MAKTMRFLPENLTRIVTKSKSTVEPSGSLHLSSSPVKMRQKNAHQPQIFLLNNTNLQLEAQIFTQKELIEKLRVRDGNQS